ncbi:MAG: molybdopterin-dependent oxidoreductase [Acidobacteria bacterium]|nr:molybdopterin-dependent oxidoreductase [Acidobacteriota bacterium]
MKEASENIDKWPDGLENSANALKERRSLSAEMSDAEARKVLASRSRRGFLLGGVAALAGIFGWRWLPEETKVGFLQNVFRFNESVTSAIFDPTRLSPQFPVEKVTRPSRVNGFLGIESEIDLDAWRLNIGGIQGRSSDLVLTMDDIRKLPKTESITEFKCIEGWSTIVQWTGIRFSDFVTAYTPWKNPEDMPPYVSLATPDGAYFVGWDTPSIMHPQTLLVYEMNGEMLTSNHGAPLRLASPTKYGIKQLKRIGRIDFTHERPQDYWANEGYDWYSGL